MWRVINIMVHTIFHRIVWHLHLHCIVRKRICNDYRVAKCVITLRVDRSCFLIHDYMIQFAPPQKKNKQNTNTTRFLLGRRPDFWVDGFVDVFGLHSVTPTGLQTCRQTGFRLHSHPFLPHNRNSGSPVSQYDETLGR
jgi:hypothetical protein